MAKANVVNTLVVPAESKVFPYYDDFDEDKNFKRILFRPGYAVQARELTQLQTILQNQIERFGQHIFENGSPVIGGDIIWDASRRAIAVNLQSTYAGTDIDVSKFKGRTILLATANTSNTMQFQVAATSPGSNTEPPAIFGNFLIGDERDLPDGSTIKTKVDQYNSDVIYANLTSSGATTPYASIASLRDSIFFFNGFFTKVAPQNVIVTKYGISNTTNVSIGLEFDDSIVTEISDTSLLDPAQESFNYQAPGAARYKTELVLATREPNSVDKKNFIELARVEYGILKKIVKYPMYSEIEEVLARRTFDESGNYTVRPFSISLDIDRVDPINFINARLSPGKAYVYGYEFETIAPTDIRVPKALSKANVRNFTLNLNQGNYVIVDGLNGIFDTSRMQQIDMHCVPTVNVDVTSSTTYNKTKIGTARIKDINFFSGDTDVTTRKYEFYIFDTQFKTITSNAVVRGYSTNVALYNGATILSSTPDAYKNATLRVVSGPGAGYVYDILSYDGANKVINLASEFVEAIANNSNLAIEFDFNDVQSFVVDTTLTGGNPTYKANANINILSKSDGLANGETFITESSLDILVFPLPERYVANGIFGEAYVYRKRFDTVEFTNGSSAASPITAASSGGTPLEDFVGGSASSNIASTVLDNFFLVVTDKKSTSRKVGDIVKANTSVTGSPESVVFDTSGSTGDTFTATVFAKMQYRANVEPKLKTLVLANTKTFATESPINIANGPTGSSANVYLSTGQVVITNPSRQVGVSESLYISDVVAIKKIYDLAGANASSVLTSGADLTQYTDVTNRYEFDNGQKGSFYDHASIRLRPNYSSCLGPLVVCCRYYQHTQPTGSGGFFTVDSYPELANIIFEEGTNIGVGYTLIPQFRKNDGTIIELRDSIDFRPTRQNATNTHPSFAYNLNSYSAASITPPIAATDFDINYDYYVGRRDLIVLTGDKILKRVEGTPAKFPQDPVIPSRSMVLYALTVNPYTPYPSNVIPRYVENKRYTMRDIGKIEKRVENLEYYVTLNNLEKSAVDLPIRDVDGLNRTKYGIFADTFVGHSLGNSNLVDYMCAMDYKQGWLQCKSKTKGFTLKANVAASSGVSFYRDRVLLNNVEVPWLRQDVASKWAPVSEFLYASFDGKIYCLPEADIWKSITKQPDIVNIDEVTNEYVNFTILEIQDPDGTFYDTIVDSGSRNPTVPAPPPPPPPPPTGGGTTTPTNSGSGSKKDKRIGAFTVD